MNFYMKYKQNVIEKLNKLDEDKLSMKYVSCLWLKCMEKIN